MNDETGLTPLERKLLRGAKAVNEALDAGEPLEKRFTTHRWTLDVAFRDYSPDDLKAVRAKLGASQSLLAEFLGVSVKTLRGWEQGSRAIPGLAARFLDEIRANPDMWEKRLRRASRRDGAPLPPSARLGGEAATVEAEEA